MRYRLTHIIIGTMNPNTISVTFGTNINIIIIIIIINIIIIIIAATVPPRSVRSIGIDHTTIVLLVVRW